MTRTLLKLCAWCRRFYDRDGAPYGRPQPESVDNRRDVTHGACAECAARLDADSIAASNPPQPDRVLNAFLAEVASHGVAVPDPYAHDRFHYGYGRSVTVAFGPVTVQLVRDSAEGRIVLATIESTSRGHGHASAAMNLLRSIARRHRVDVELVADPFGPERDDAGTKRLGKGALVAWYRRHGFKAHRGRMLQRNPPRDGDSYFDTEALRLASRQSSKSRERLVHMDPRDFLAVAERLDGPDEGKARTVLSVLDRGHAFSSIPMLNFEHDGKGTARVTGHEGRHRAYALAALGVTSMPVVLRSLQGEGDEIRWGEQDDPRSFDRIRGPWPAVLRGETSGSIPFPVPDLRVAANPPRGYPLRRRASR